MIYEYGKWWNDTDRKAKEFGEKYISVPCCPP
jgi:hypothetical protein